MFGIRAALALLVILVSCDAKRVRRQIATQCQDVADIITLVDGSDSIRPRDFATLKSNLQVFTDKLDISPDATRFGAIVFSSAPTIIGDVVELSGDRYSVRSKIGSLNQPRLGTDTAKGLERMMQMFQASRRPGIPQIGIVLTDGESLQPPLTASTASRLKNAGVTLISVSVGSEVSQEELNAIASSNNLIFGTNTFNLNGLETLVKAHTVQNCPPVTCPCQNSGTCNYGPNGQFQFCTCPVGYTGTYCESKINCPCQNGGVCNFGVNGFQFCTCPAGYTGTYCEQVQCNCLNGGVCINGFQCSCPPSYTGTKCESKINCPCQNGGVCNFGVNGFQYCTCPAGYTGTYCEQAVTTCTLACQNGGYCMNGASGMYCQCQFGYTGNLCQFGTVTQPPVSPSPADPGLCIDCKVFGGVGYNNHPSNCNKFIQCNPVDGIGSPMVAIIKDCPVGLWFNIDSFNCDYPKNVPGCKNDPCAPGNVGRKYQDGANCRTYYTCEDGASVLKCCEAGTGFDGTNCSPNVPCKQECVLNRVGPLPGVCDKKADPTDFYKFLQRVGNDWVKMDCAPGTNFDPATCYCSDPAAVKPFTIPVTPSNGICEPELDLQFNGDIVDEAHGWWVHQENVSIANGAAYFDGSSKLVVTRFANLDYQRPLVIKVRYRTEGSFISGKQAVISNGDCFELPSAAIAATGNGAEFLAQTESMATSTTLNVNANSGNWNDAIYIATDGRFEGRVNGAKQMQDIEGFIMKKPCALTIGAGTGYSNFVGFIDYVQVYLCMPSGL